MQKITPFLWFEDKAEDAAKFYVSIFKKSKVLKTTRYSDSVTAIVMPEGHDADVMRTTARERFNVSLGGGLGKLKGSVFRIGHLGDLNEPMVLGALSAVEMSLRINGVPHGKGGVDAAMDYLAG